MDFEKFRVETTQAEMDQVKQQKYAEGWTCYKTESSGERITLYFRRPTRTKIET
jgi:hypothetical protein